MSLIDGLPQPADINLFQQAMAKIIKYGYANQGLDLPGETGTQSYYADLAAQTLLGDGTTSNPGLSSPTWKRDIGSALKALPSKYRWDTLISANLRGYYNELDTLVKNNIPKNTSDSTQTWQFTSISGAPQHMLDYHLLRLNACNSNVPTTPANAVVLTAITDANGAMSTVVGGSAPYVVYTLVASKDYYESLPSPVSTQVALSGSQNGYSTAIAGTIPAGVTKIRFYRTVNGGSSSGPFFWLMDVACSAGAYASQKLLGSDNSLKTSVQPPSWFQCPWVPENAIAFAIANQTVNSFSQVGTPPPVQLASAGMLTAQNCVFGPANQFTGYNPPQSFEFGRSSITGLNTQSFVAGTLASASNASQNVQGFLGGKGVQARVITNINGTATFTFTYTFYDAAHGFGNVQTSTSQTVVASSLTVGQTVALGGITAGRIVLSVSVTAVAGTATAGVVVWETPQWLTY